MALHEISKGLDLPIESDLKQVIRGTEWPTRVAVMADDFPGMKPAMKVEEGQTVQRGQVLFEDRKCPGVQHTAPGAGRVLAIHRGARRVLQSVVIDLNDRERAGDLDPQDAVSFSTYTGKRPAELTREQIVDLLVESGQWTALRTRPYSRTPGPDTRPHSIFVTAVDTHPLAPDPEIAIGERREDFLCGLEVVSKLTDGTTWLCVGEVSRAADGVELPNVSVERFKGPHPSGTAGLHIHLLDPVHRDKTVWSIGYDDVIAIGSLFATGALDVRRLVTIAGPPVENERLAWSRLGASTEDLAGSDGEGEVRLIAGSVLSGKKAMGENFGYLGRHDRQLSILREGRERVFLGWLTPGARAFSTLPISISRFFPQRKFDFTTTTNGSERVIIPIGQFERVMPFDIQPTYLLRALAVGDLEEIEKLGGLELDEEDLALCSFVCSGKNDYGPMLRRNLETIEKEG